MEGIAMASATIIIAVSSLAGLLVIAGAVLQGWQGWLALKNRELERASRDFGGDVPSGAGTMTARIEIADLKERIRRLEAIAAGVDL